MTYDSPELSEENIPADWVQKIDVYVKANLKYPYWLDEIEQNNV